MNSRFVRHLEFSLAALDFITLNTLFFLVEYVFLQKWHISSEKEYTYFGIFLNIAWITVTYFCKLYQEKYVVSFESFAKRSVQAYIYFLGLLVCYLFFSKLFIIKRSFLLIALFCIAAGLLFNRFIYLAIYHYFKKKDFLINKVVVIGYNNLSKKFVRYLEEEGINKEIIGYCEEPKNVKELSNYPILSNVSEAVNICKQYGAMEIYSTIAPEHHESIYQLISNADDNCIRFRIIPDIAFFVKRKVHIDFLNEIPVISLRNEPLEDLGNRIKKRIFDIVVSSAVLMLVLSWLIPIIGLLIWIESKGPIFFKQSRSGKDNKIFPCLKFRSMRMNDNAHMQQASKNDNRITVLGRFLRRSSLDEFPQFINVLKGHMSIVGPRPHMLKHTNDYSKLIGQYMVRQMLKPGITGWAQVNGLRGETQTVMQMQKRVEHDLWYMENWSLWLDLRIIFMTVYNTLKGDSNAF